MRYIDYNNLYIEIITKLATFQTITLATSSQNRPTARNVTPVNAGTVIMFQMSKKSDAITQLKQNPNVALAAENIQIMATAKLFGHPMHYNNADFIKLYKDKFPVFYNDFSHREELEVIRCTSSKITVARLIDKVQFKEVLDIELKIAYRQEL